MFCRSPRLATLLAITCLGLTSSAPFASGKKDQQTPVSAQMDEQKRAAHALNRLTFGPRPGDIARATAVGMDKWIEQQLHPEKIDDSALDTRLASFRTLHMNTRELVENFPSPQLIKAVMDGKKPMPSDPVKRAIYQAQIERLQEKEERKQEAANTVDPGTTMNPDAVRTASMPISKPNRFSTCLPTSA